MILSIDASALEEFQRCPLAYWYRHGLKRDRAVEKPDLLFGRHVHKALVGPEGFSQVLVECYAKEPLPEEDFRTLGRANELLHAYYHGCTSGKPGQANCYEHLGYKDTWTVLEREKAFQQHLGNIGAVEVNWTGRRDLLVEDSSGLWVVDYKTTKEFNSESFWGAYGGPHTAMLGYCWQVREQYGRMPLGYIIDVLCARKPLQVVRPNSAPRNEFARKAFRITEAALEKWRVNTLCVIGDLLRCAERSFWPQHDRKGFNCAWCAYNQVCQQPDELSAQNLLASGDYKDYTWTPLGAE